MKTQRNILVIALMISLFLHLLYGLEGASQVQAYEYTIQRQAAQLQDKEQQISVLEIILECQENPKPEPKEVYAGEFEITYYCPCTKCCGKTDGIAASGALAQEGQTVAADWSMLPPGTKLYIEEIGFRTVEDKGGAIKGKALDVFVNSHTEALELGRHKADVWIVKEVK